MADAGFLLDTNICIYALSGVSGPLRQRFEEQGAGRLFVSAISLAEISVGYGDRVFDAPDLATFLEVVRVLPFDETAARIYGTLPFRRTRFDRLIAAHALALGLTVVTNNEADFADVPGLIVENWALPA